MHHTEDLFEFVIDTVGTYVIETDVATDVALAVFGPRGLTTLVGRDGRLRIALRPGKYFAAVRRDGATRGSDYGIRVMASR